MKKIIITCLLSITSLLTIQYFYIQTTSKSQLSQFISTLKNDSVKNQHPNPIQELEEESLVRNIKVLDVKTGFHASNLWYPSVIIKFKNNSSSDIRQYSKAKAIFIDTETNEQIGVHTKYLSTTNNFFLQGTSLRKQFKSDIGYQGSFTNLKISVKLYVEDQLIGTYSIENKQI